MFPARKRNNTYAVADDVEDDGSIRQYAQKSWRAKLELQVLQGSARVAATLHPFSFGSIVKQQGEVDVTVCAIASIFFMSPDSVEVVVMFPARKCNNNEAVLDDVENDGSVRQYAHKSWRAKLELQVLQGPYRMAAALHPFSFGSIVNQQGGENVPVCAIASIFFMLRVQKRNSTEAVTHNIEDDGFVRLYHTQVVESKAYTTRVLQGSSRLPISIPSPVAPS